MFKKVLVTVATTVVIGFVASLFTLGPSKTWTHLRAAVGLAEQHVDDNLEDRHLQEVVRVKLKDLDSQIRGYHVALGKLEDRYSAVETETANQERTLEGEKLLLKRAGELLDEGGETCTIAGKTVTRAQLTADAQGRLARCEVLKQRIESNRQLAQQLKQAVDEGRSSLQESERIRNQMVTELEALKVRLAAARQREELNELAGALREAPTVGPESELARSLGQLKDRTREAERLADSRSGQAKTGTINWSESNDPREAISALLKEGSTKKPNVP